MNGLLWEVKAYRQQAADWLAAGSIEKATEAGTRAQKALWLAREAGL